VAVSEVQLNFDFRHPLVGHLPGYLAISEAAGTDQPSWDEYADLLMRQWHALWSVPAFLDTGLGCQLTELPIS